MKGIPMGHLKSICRTSRAGQNRSETNFALPRRILATCITLASLAGSHSVEAADLSVMVVGRDGRGVDEVVVTAMPEGAGTESSPIPRPAIMDQKNLAFLPRVLVVATGTRVEFPNNDSVSHQVYSFSAAKRFQLPLYKGEVHPPVVFDRPGLVVLGCNIHDAMVGYIYVTGSPYFGTTAAGGDLQLKGLPAGDYRVTIWSPFIADAPTSLSRTVHVDGHGSASMRMQLSLALRALPEPKPRRRDWEY
ncbi:MAG TPA: methylamine utilization protein [Steroidobacteraceae bacterium]|nr:methylamine utilization protein [Steroidobacteraceae bacterium]